MPLILNDNFTYADDSGEILDRLITERIDFYMESTKKINEIDLVFLKSCGYYEMLVDEILKNIGFKDLDKMGIAVKIKTLVNIIHYEELKKSTEEYLKMTSFRNSVAHEPQYRLEDDIKFYTKILKLDKIDKTLEIKNMIMRIFVKIYSKPLFVLTGIILQDNDNNFLKFKKLN